MRQIGRYQIRNELGRGGMAIVYRAHDPRFEREVAIKLLPRQFTHEPDFIERFQKEAKIIAALEHPAIVPVYDFGEHEDAPYLVMRFMAGGSLQDRLKGRPLPIPEISTIYDRLASGLDKAHQRGIIHRDLKPDNVFFDEDNLAFLGDFGIARMAEATQTMTIIGTPAYMSPEQAQGNQKLDWRCDIYAMGAMLFQLLTGKQPFVAESATGQMLMHVLQPVPDVLEANPELPPEAQNIINKAMAKERTFRYQTAKALAEDIRLLLPGNNGAAAAAAGAALTGAATMVESPKVATVVDSAPYQAPTIMASVGQGTEPGQTLVPTTFQQTKVPPTEKKRQTALIWVSVSLAVVLLLVALGGGYLLGADRGGETTAVVPVSAEGPENALSMDQTASPTASLTPTDLPTAAPSPSPSETPAATQEIDGDGDGLVGVVDKCPEQSGPLETGGCPVTPTATMTATSTDTPVPTATATVKLPADDSLPPTAIPNSPLPVRPSSPSSFANLKDMGRVNIDLTTNQAQHARFTWEWDGTLQDGEYLEVRAGKVGEPLKTLGTASSTQESTYDVGLLQISDEAGDCYDFQWVVVHMAADKRTAIAESDKSNFEVCTTP